MKQDQLELIK